ncbi:uncharacterized protein [Triticum aestivum]|uniref:uncharacterized protein n=1 Tax=Triticum aestivum TaxID=4565 RepID=UPI001D02986A|nr:uncharacterized protein LOC123125397 [Triticum aestivum]
MYYFVNEYTVRVIVPLHGIRYLVLFPIQTSRFRLPPKDLSDLTSGGSSGSNPFAASASNPFAAPASLLSVPLSTILTLNIHGQIPVTLTLTPPNFKLWCSFFHSLFMSYGIYDHVDGSVDAKHRRHDIAWTQVDWCIVRWLYTMLSAELQGMVPQDQPSAFTLWTAICSLFLDNRTQRGLIALEEFHSLRQEHLSVMDYFTRLQTLAGTLRDCDMAVTDRGLVSNMLRGLSNMFSHAIGTMTYDETKLPTFLQARSYLLQEERRIDRAVAHEPATALHVAAHAAATPAPTPAPAPPAPPTNPGSFNNNNGQRGRKGRKGGNGGTGGSGPPAGHGRASGHAPALPPSAPMRHPAPLFPGFNPWTGTFQAWPVMPRPSGAGVLGPRPSAHGLLAATGAGPTPTPPAATWDMSSLQHALLSMPQPYSGGGDWFFDTGATSHMAADPGSHFRDGALPM